MVLVLDVKKHVFAPYFLHTSSRKTRFRKNMHRMVGRCNDDPGYVPESTG